MGEGPHVVRRHDYTSLPGYDENLHAGRICGNDRQARPHGFQDNIRKAFLATGNGENIKPSQHFPCVDSPGQMI